jgi:radical SAM superfamily enzyme YgiQ (UPF0313 family)
LRKTADERVPNNRLVHLIKIDNRIYRDVPPLGLLYLGDSLRKAGYEVEVHQVLSDEIEECARRVVDRGPLFAGLSVVTGWGVEAAAELSRMIKAESEIPVVWGNVHPSHLPQQCLEEDYIDIVCVGEGEVTVVELAHALDRGGDLGGIAGIGYTADGRVVMNERRPHSSDLDQFEPDWDLVDIERYITPCWGIERTLRVIASRGCPYDCSFCYNQAFNLREWRRHSADYTIGHLSALAEEHDINAFYFNDDNFFVDVEWAWKVLEGIGLPYFVNVRPEFITEPFAAKLAETGCKELLVGFESGSDRVLNEILYKRPAANNLNAIEALRKHPEIQVTGSFMTALPGETDEEARKTIDMICHFLEIHPNIRVILAFYRPMPGTELYRIALDQGFIPPATTEGWSSYDALSNKHDLPWLDERSSRERAAMCSAMDVLAALYKFDVPILKSTVRRQVLAGNYESRTLSLMNAIRTRYAFDRSDGRGARLLRWVVDGVKRRRNLE